jgi:hypothetical protein
MEELRALRRDLRQLRWMVTAVLVLEIAITVMLYWP